MKKLTIFLIAVLLLTAFMPMVNAEVNNDKHDVTGKYKSGGRTDLFSVDIIWQGMKFDYHAASEAWNSTTHEWETTGAAQWTIAENSGNEIAITNHSSMAVNVRLSATYVLTGIGGTFSENSFTLPKPAEGTDVGESKTVTFMPNGKLDEDVTDYAKIGAITVSIIADQPTVNVYTVQFVDFDGKVLKTQDVEEGGAATAPANPVRDGYKFVKWDKAFDNVMTNLTVNAVYQEAADPTIYVGNVEAEAGDTVEVPVYIKNNPGIAGATITIAYDEKLELTSARNGEAFADLTYTKPGKFQSPCNFLWDSESGMVYDDDVVLTLTFKVSSNAQAGEELDISCSYRTGDIYDEELNDVTFDMLSGMIRVK